MSREHDDARIDREVEALNPAPTANVRSRLSRRDLDAARGRAIRMAGAEGGTSGPRSPTLSLLLAGGAAALAAAAVVFLLVGSSPSGSGIDGSLGIGGSAGQTSTESLDENPRYLVTAPGWEITYAESAQPDAGSVKFSDGTDVLELNWYPADSYEDYRSDRADVSGPDIPITVAGLQSTMVQYAPRPDFAVMLPPEGDLFAEIRGDLGSEEMFRKIIASVERVDSETWLAALPDSAVQPDEQVAIVDSLLEGVPLPPGFDLDRLREEAVLDPEQLDYEVAFSVACGWLDSWAAADQAGDEAAKASAVEAMAGAERWPAVRRLPEVQVKRIGEYALQIADGRLDREFGSAVIIEEDGDRFEYGPGYALALGCDSQTKRPVEAPSGDDEVRGDRPLVPESVPLDEAPSILRPAPPPEDQR